METVASYNLRLHQPPCLNPALCDCLVNVLVIHNFHKPINQPIKLAYSRGVHIIIDLSRDGR